MLEKPVQIQNILVDIHAIYSIAHTCDPTVCSIKNCCCSRYQICVDESEIESMINLTKDAAALSDALMQDGALANVFEEEDHGRYSIESRDNGLCVYGYQKSGKILCSLHSAALKYGLPPRMYKPAVCTLWPLALDEGELPVLSVQDDALTFPCVREIDPRTLSLSPEIEQTILWLFGEAFVEEVKREAKRCFG